MITVFIDSHLHDWKNRTKPQHFPTHTFDGCRDNEERKLIQEQLQALHFLCEDFQTPVLRRMIAPDENWIYKHWSVSPKRSSMISGQSARTAIEAGWDPNNVMCCRWWKIRKGIAYYERQISWERTTRANPDYKEQHEVEQSPEAACVGE